MPNCGIERAEEKLVSGRQYDQATPIRDSARRLLDLGTVIGDVLQHVEIKDGAESGATRKRFERAGDDAAGERQLSFLDPVGDLRCEPLIGLETNPVPHTGSA